MYVIRIIDIAIAVLIFLISASDLYKGVLMVFKNRHPLLFMAQISFLILRLLPVSIRESRYQKSMNIYIKRRKLYGLFALVGGSWGILLSVVIILNS